mmetsp:Transcript_78601/g.222320  ORF Transcript_78601/g.222320 Transcript_78601/m.222320 type:complete len:134 (-) Transcript_78601:196-597(-)
MHPVAGKMLVARGFAARTAPLPLRARGAGGGVGAHSDAQFLVVAVHFTRRAVLSWATPLPSEPGRAWARSDHLLDGAGRFSCWYSRMLAEAVRMRWAVWPRMLRGRGPRESRRARGPAPPARGGGLSRRGLCR